LEKGDHMKIERIECFPLNAKIAKPIKIAYTQFTHVRSHIVRLTTDNGISGIGESVTRTAPRAFKYLIEETLSPHIIGKDPIDLAGVWWEMFSAMKLRGHTKGHFVEAISGVDIALWDIVSKGYGLPLYKALHGFGRREIPVYGSSVFNGEIDDMISQAESLVAKEYPAIKVKLGMGLKKDIQAIDAIRAAIGSDIGIMVDINSNYHADDAVRLGRKLEPYDIEWLEEPVPPFDLAGYTRVRQGQSIPVAGGEGEFTVYGFRDLLAANGVDIIQPDLGRVGGLTEGLRIAALAQAQNIKVAPHTGFFSSLNILAAMHFSAATPAFHTFEFMELDHPLIEIFTEPIPRPKKGMLALPEKPGIGYELDMMKIEPWIEE
jgi:D-arabinonate dehydratase/D-galactarolactone cycloisomerase